MARTWDRNEIIPVLDAYFAMFVLQSERAGYTKAEVIRSIAPRLPGRSRHAIERKCCNVSAILEELGLPRVTGFQPASHYQSLLRDLTERWLDSHPYLTAVMNRVQSEGPPKR